MKSTRRPPLRPLSATAGTCLACLALPLLLLGAVAHADDLSADDIAKRMVRGDAFAWEGAKSKVRMVLLGKAGKRKERAMEVVGRRAAGLFQTVVRFTAPADIAGTAFLMLERKDGASEQYVYLSGLKRTRRIVGREREGSFMGSDFTYADMQRVDSRYAAHKRLPDDKVGKDATYVLESKIKADSGSQYSKVVTWVRKSDFVALRTRFYDRGGKLEKTLYTRRVRELEGRPVVVDARMQSAKSDHATELYVDAVERRDDLQDVAFTPAALEHM